MVKSDRVLATFMPDDRLLAIPRRRAKRMVVLAAIVQSFEPGVHYSEPEVNAILGEVHADVAAVRRYLVDCGLLDRHAGEHWQAGGTVES